MSFSSLNQEMPYLDSFIKETARLSPGPIRKPATHSTMENFESMY